MRENAKWVFYILAFAFIAWMVFDVSGLIGGPGTIGSGDAVIEVNGRPIRAQEYQLAVNNAFEAYRVQSGTGPLTREDEEALRNQVADDLIRDRLLEREYRRLGIRVSDREIIDAARSSPLPELLQHPDLQTNGRFDADKYQRLLSTGADPQLLQYIESRYREQIPQIKLAQYLTADVYVSDAKLWRIYRDRADSVTAAVLVVHPQTVPDDATPVSAQEIERYYADNRDAFKRPAVAHLSFVAVPRHTNASDTVAARQRVAELREEVVTGGADVFAEVARRESADSGSRAEGGDLGWFPRADPPFVPEFTAAVRALRPGQVSEPVATQFGYHLIRLAEARRDSLRASHILVAIELAGEHLEQVEDRADSLDRIAGAQTSGSMLDTAAAVLQLPIGIAPPLVEGERLRLGRYVVPDVSIWAFEAAPGETSPVIEATPAFYVFRLDSLIPAGTRPLSEVRTEVERQARLAKKKAVARQRAADALAALRAEPSLAASGPARGYRVETETVTRLQPRGVFQDEPVLIGAAFGLRVGERSGVIEGRHGAYVVEVLARQKADSAAWVAQRDVQRQTIIDAARQSRIQLYLEDLRSRATIVDRRKELARAVAAAQAGS